MAAKRYPSLMKIQEFNILQRPLGLFHPTTTAWEPASGWKSNLQLHIHKRSTSNHNAVPQAATTFYTIFSNSQDTKQREQD